MSVPICNRFHAIEDNCGKITIFWRGKPSLTPACAGLLEPRGSGIGLLKSAIMLKISYTSCLSLPLAISSQFTVKMFTASKNCEKCTKNPLLDGSRSFKVIDVDKSKKPVISACYDKQHVCRPTYLQPFSH